MFAATGRGASASITEYRYGIQADIGLDMDFGETINKCWIFKGHLGRTEAMAEEPPYHHILLSLPDSSAVLSLPQDLSDAIMHSIEETGLDARRTLDAMQVGETIVQVTEHSTVLLSPLGRHVQR
jgi:hypothetical protein